MGDEMKQAETGMPSLTLEPDFAPEVKKEPEVQVQGQLMEVAPEMDPVQQKMAQTVLTPEEQKMVDDFASKIDVENLTQVMQYGAGTQKKMADFSDEALKNVRAQDLGEVGELLSGVVGELKGFDAEEEKGFLGFFKKQANKVENLKNRYDKAEVNVEKIADALEKHQVRLLKDSAMMDKMYEQNLLYFKELSMYIQAGKQRLAQTRNGKLHDLEEKAKMTGLPEDAQAAKDLDSKCARFEKKLHDLELTRMISLQTAPQIRLVQNNDTMMAEKIQTTLVNTIPLWKSQMVLALGIAHSTEAAQAQSQVSDLTNELLRKNAEKLHMASVETAKESERGIVDMETLQKTNADLIQTLDDVMKIQKEGREKRQKGEKSMYRDHTKVVQIGNKKIGGGNPILIQSMTNTKTEDVEATVRQILELEAAGCDIIRCAVPTMEAAQALKEIKKQIHIPLVADIHFDYRLAIAAMENGADKIRINPGNIGSTDRIQAVVDVAKERNIPIRVGVNSGSLEKELVEKYHGVTAEGLVESALDKVRIIEEMGYDNLVISIKSSDVMMCAKAHELIAEKTDHPLHVGITEAGTLYSGNIKSAVGLGIILSQGIGDTIRVSLTGAPLEEIKSAKRILKTLGLRKGGVEVVSCPTCGRTRIDLIGLANKVEAMVQDIPLDIKVAVMGCVVNGPGEAKEADIGIAGGVGVGLLIKKGEIVKKVPEDQLLDTLREELLHWEG